MYAKQNSGRLHGTKYNNNNSSSNGNSGLDKRQASACFPYTLVINFQLVCKFTFCSSAKIFDLSSSSPLFKDALLARPLFDFSSLIVFFAASSSCLNESRSRLNLSHCFCNSNSNNKKKTHTESQRENRQEKIINKDLFYFNFSWHGK